MRMQSATAIACIIICFFVIYSYAGTTVTRSLNVDGVQRKFIVYIPSSYNQTNTIRKTTRVPLLFFFHGWMSNMNEAASGYYNWKDTADRKGFIVIFPDSLTPPCKNLTLSAFGRNLIDWKCYDKSGKRWDIAHAFNGLPIPGYQSKSKCQSYDLNFVRSLYAFANSTYNIDTSQVFFGGHSFGALFSYYATTCLYGLGINTFFAHSGGMHHEDILTGTVALGIEWPIAVPTNKPMSAMLVHDKADKVVPFWYSEYLEATFVRRGYNVTFYEISMCGNASSNYHDYHNQFNDDLWKFLTGKLAKDKSVVPVRAVADSNTRSSAASYGGLSERFIVNAETGAVQNVAAVAAPEITDDSFLNRNQETLQAEAAQPQQKQYEDEDEDVVAESDYTGVQL